MHRSIPRHATPLLAGAVLFLLSGCGRLESAVGVAAGFASHQLCSATFISKVEPETFYREAIAPTVAPLGFLLSHQVDRAHAEVTASFAGLAERRAVYRGAEGCLVLRDPPPPPPATVAAEQPGPSLLPPIAGPPAVEPADPALKAALDRAFAETPSPPHRATKAVVVLRDGQVIAERYAPGYGVDTPIIGWSATKSVTNALIGILVRQGKLSLDGPAPIAEWADPMDPRHAITIDNLLRMTSGLDIGQSLVAGVAEAFDPSVQMVFDERDMAAFAARAPLRARPGTAWNYTNGNTLLLSRLIRDQAGGSAASVLDFAHRELFDKLGMRGVTLELDATGTPIGSSHMLAPARAWARFGQLYLDDGVIGGSRVLPAGWVDYSATLTPGSETYGYGAGFWTDRGASDGARIRTGYGIPPDAFMARGAFGQYVVIVPSRRLVVVRMGMAFTPRDDMETVGRLVADVIAAGRGRSAMR
jgi:CubicO group peptidase (beta-lactamase class C family)